MLYDRTQKKWPFNTGDCLIEVNRWVGLTVSRVGLNSKIY